MRTPRREAGSLINRPVTRRTIVRSRHPCTGGTAVLLLLSTTTELVVLHLIPQHDPQSDPEFASYSHSRLPQTLLHQFPAVKTLQRRISADRVCSRLTPEKAQQRIALFAQPTEPLLSSTGVFPRDHPYITSQGLAVSESCWITQEHFGRQRRDRPHSGMGHQQPCAGSFASLLLDSLV